LASGIGFAGKNGFGGGITAGFRRALGDPTAEIKT
jgi:hypothetical protein